MLTRLQVRGFKSLVDADMRFGPFTCIAGPNGAGKSNLFDAIQFLSELADNPLMEAAAAVRARSGSNADARQLFHRTAGYQAAKMSFAADMIVPRSAVDDLGLKAEATATLLRYSLELGYRKTRDRLAPATLEILREELIHLPKGDAPEHLLFPHEAGSWRKSAVRGERRAPFISTAGSGAAKAVRQHRDGGRGRLVSRPAAKLPRTILSAADAATSPTAAVARREMAAWRRLQMEPAALQRPDGFAAPASIAPDGGRLAATLHRLARGNPGRAYEQIAGELSLLVDDVRSIEVDADEARGLLTLHAKNRQGTRHPAHALSSGALRLLALVALLHDPEAQGALCLEEPENGIHPGRIPDLLELLQDIAVDPEMPVGPDNPLRQVIVNTHSPTVFQQAPDDSLVFAETSEVAVRRGQVLQGASFFCLSGTWRTRAENSRVLAPGCMLPYLFIAPPADDDEASAARKRVIDRDDATRWLPGAAPA